MPDQADDLNKLLEALDTCLAPQGLLFDLDGVIADVEESYRRCILETAGGFGVEVTRAEVAAEVLAGDANNDWVLTQRILASRGIEVLVMAFRWRGEIVSLGWRRSLNNSRPYRNFKRLATDVVLWSLPLKSSITPPQIHLLLRLTATDYFGGKRDKL